jgi:hypothetical protein
MNDIINGEKSNGTGGFPLQIPTLSFFRGKKIKKSITINNILYLLI